MINVHLKDGQTLAIDLEGDEKQAKEVLRQLGRASFQERITAVTLCEKHATKQQGEICTRHSVTRPQGFDRIWFEVDHIPGNGRQNGRGDRLTLFAGDTRLVVMAHRSQPASRISLARVGKRQFNPGL